MKVTSGGPPRSFVSELADAREFPDEWTKQCDYDARYGPDEEAGNGRLPGSTNVGEGSEHGEDAVCGCSGEAGSEDRADDNACPPQQTNTANPTDDQKDGDDLKR